MANGARSDGGRYTPLPSVMGQSEMQFLRKPSREVPCLLSDFWWYHYTTVTRVVIQCISPSHIFPCLFPSSPSLYHSGQVPPSQNTSCSTFYSSWAQPGLAGLYQHHDRGSEWRGEQKFKGPRVRSVFKLTPRFLTWTIRWPALAQFLTYIKPSVNIY